MKIKFIFACPILKISSQDRKTKKNQIFVKKNFTFFSKFKTRMKSLVVVFLFERNKSEKRREFSLWDESLFFGFFFDDIYVRECE
jgi:hypothetical protein